jgi:hypothetical protein
MNAVLMKSIARKQLDKGTTSVLNAQLTFRRHL